MVVSAGRSVETRTLIPRVQTECIQQLLRLPLQLLRVWLKTWRSGVSQRSAWWRNYLVRSAG